MNYIQAEFELSGTPGVKIVPVQQKEQSSNKKIAFTAYFPSTTERLKNSTGKDCWADFYTDGTARISGDEEMADDYVDSKEFREILADKFQTIVLSEEACVMVKKYVSALS